MKYIFYLLYLDKGRFIVHIHSDQSCGSRWKNQRKNKHMLKETERLALSMTNLAELLRSMAKASMCKAHKSVRLSGQTLRVFFMRTDAFQKMKSRFFRRIQNCQESYLSDTFIFFFVLSPSVCLFWHSSAPLLPCPSDLFAGNENQQSF